MKRLKPSAEPIPRKFQPGDRVKPTAEAMSLGWTKPGVVVSCGVHAVQVLMDGEDRDNYYAVDYWMPDGKDEK